MGPPARQRLSAVHFLPKLLLAIFPGDSGMWKNPCIHPIWSQIVYKIAKNTRYPLCKNTEEAQIVALAARALCQIQKLLAELALANPTQAPRAPRRPTEALQPCLLLSKMIFHAVTSSTFYVSNISSNSLYCFVLSVSPQIVQCYFQYQLCSHDSLQLTTDTFSGGTSIRPCTLTSDSVHLIPSTTIFRVQDVLGLFTSVSASVHLLMANFRRHYYYVQASFCHD